MALQTEIVKVRKFGSFLEAIGRVTNQSDAPVQDACAVVSSLDHEGNLIQMDSARIKRPILMPGECSPFKVICLWNPKMVRGRIEVSLPWAQRVAETQQTATA